MTVLEFYNEINSSYDEAKSRLMNDAFIVKFLKKFHDQYTLDELNKAYEEKDVEEIFKVSHALKGVVGNLALHNLFVYISDICEATRHAPNFSEINIKDELDKLNVEFKRTLDLIALL